MYGDYLVVKRIILEFVFKYVLNFFIFNKKYKYFKLVL